MSRWEPHDTTERDYSSAQYSSGSVSKNVAGSRWYLYN
jgi:hypothetical protein